MLAVVLRVLPFLADPEMAVDSKPACHTDTDLAAHYGPSTSNAGAGCACWRWCVVSSQQSAVSNCGCGAVHGDVRVLAAMVGMMLTPAYGRVGWHDVSMMAGSVGMCAVRWRC